MRWMHITPIATGPAARCMQATAAPAPCAPSHVTGNLLPRLTMLRIASTSARECRSAGTLFGTIHMPIQFTSQSALW